MTSLLSYSDSQDSDAKLEVKISAKNPHNKREIFTRDLEEKLKLLLTIKSEFQ